MVRSQIIESSRAEAITFAENMSESIIALLGDHDKNHTLSKKFLEKINRTSLDGKRVRITRSFSVTSQYGAGRSAKAKSHKEAASIVDGTIRIEEDQESFNVIAPIKAEKSCGRCHVAGNGRKKRIAEGAILGVAIVKTSKSAMNERISTLLKETGLNMLIVTGMLLFLSVMLEKQLVAPLRKLLISIQKISKRRSLEKNEEADGYEPYSWANNAESHGDDSFDANAGLDSVATGFQKVAKRFEKSIGRLEGWNEELGLEIASRTDQLRKIKNHFQSIIDSTQRVIYTTDTELVIDSVNAEWDKQAKKFHLGLNRKDIIGKNVLEFISNDMREEYREACKTIFESDIGSSASEMYNSEFDLNIDGVKKYYGLTISPLRDSKGGIDGLVFVSIDISERRRAEEMLLVEKNKLDTIMNGMGAPVNIISEDYRITYANRIMESMFGSGMVGKTCHEVVAKSMDKCIGCDLDKTKESASFEIQAANGQIYLVTRSLIKDIDNKTSMIEVYKDITYLKEMEGKLRKLTITDNLTGLYNKRYFMTSLADEMARSQRQKVTFALLFADIDKFKAYNDVYGHVEGDTCLARLGKIVRESIRSHVDTGYRYGGEEFTMILQGADEEMALNIAERIRTGFGTYRFIPKRDGKPEEVFKTVSIGVAVYDGKQDISAFIDQADSAMYSAKRAGGNRTEIA